MSAIKHQQVAAGTTAKQVAAAGGNDTYVHLTNGAAVVYLGGDASVSSSTGMPVPASAVLPPIVINGDDELWVVCATSSTVGVLTAPRGD